ncbi:hypothetical protein ACQ86F_00320 [Streptomyces venezuelae ATCC 10712]
MALPDVGADPARTTTSMVPVPPLMSVMARPMDAGTTAPEPFMVKAGPFQDARLTSEALPSRILFAPACASGWAVSVRATDISATAAAAELRESRDAIWTPRWRGGGGLGGRLKATLRISRRGW